MYILSLAKEIVGRLAQRSATKRLGQETFLLGLAIFHLLLLLATLLLPNAPASYLRLDQRIKAACLALVFFQMRLNDTASPTSLPALGWMHTICTFVLYLSWKKQLQPTFWGALIAYTSSLSPGKKMGFLGVLLLFACLTLRAIFLPGHIGPNTHGPDPRRQGEEEHEEKRFSPVQRA